MPLVQSSKVFIHVSAAVWKTGEEDAKFRERSMTKMRQLSEVLTGIKAEKWNHALFIRGTPPFSADALCAVLDQDETDDPETDPPFAVENNLRYVLNIQDAQGIVENAELQKPDVSLSELVEAFNFYCQNDAFIELWGSGKPPSEEDRNRY